MKLLIIKFRMWLANELVKLARWIRPKDVNAWLQSVQDSLIYGNGIMRIDPKEFYNSSSPVERNLKETRSTENPGEL